MNQLLILPQSCHTYYDYHATRLFNLVDRDGQSYPYKRGHRRSRRKDFVTEDELLLLIENELDTNPTSINYVNEYKQSAFHLAVSQPVVSFNIVSALIKAHPDIVKLQNCNGNLAMHILILYQCNNDVLRLLYESYPKSLTVVNSRQETPIQTAMSKRKDSVIQQLLMIDPVTMRRNFDEEWDRLERDECDENNLNTPLHYRLYEGAPPEEILQLLKARPHYAIVSNHIRRVPYDTAKIHYLLGKGNKDTRDFILHSILRTMDAVTRELPARERQAFKKSNRYKELLDRNWSCRKGAILLATRYKSGHYFEVLKWLALFL